MQPQTKHKEKQVRLALWPHPLLQKPATRVTEFSDQLVDTAAEMTAAMRLLHGIGLAGPQLLIDQAIIVVDPLIYYSDEKFAEKNEVKPTTLINPRYESNIDTTTRTRERCLSFPDVFVDIDRPAAINLTYEDFEGKTISGDLFGLAAVAIQHEIDHLNGQTLYQRAGRLKKQLIDAKLKKFKKRAKVKNHELEITIKLSIPEKRHELSQIPDG